MKVDLRVIFIIIFICVNCPMFLYIFCVLCILCSNKCLKVIRCILSISKCSFLIKLLQIYPLTFFPSNMNLTICSYFYCSCLIAIFFFGFIYCFTMSCNFRTLYCYGNFIRFYIFIYCPYMKCPSLFQT